jgi:GNAT superfamily N-acetyltransferase
VNPQGSLLKLAERRPSRRQRAARTPARDGAGAPISIRGIEAGDYDQVMPLVYRWSRGRSFGITLPRSFFLHFANTSLVMREGDEVVGVLIGFRSQTEPASFIHFVSIAPGSRRRGLGRNLYERFFALSAQLGCTEVQAITAPISSTLIAFHRQLGFDVVEAGGFSCGIAVSPDFAGPGQHRVLFRKRIDPFAAGLAQAGR